MRSCNTCGTEYTTQHHEDDMEADHCLECNQGMKESIAQAEYDARESYCHPSHWEEAKPGVAVKNQCTCQDCVQFGVNMHEPDPNHECEIIVVNFKTKLVISRKKVA